MISGIRPILSWLRPWIASAALVVLAMLLTVPWCYFVIKAAYERDVMENAQALARRVEQHLNVTLRTMAARRAQFPFETWPFPSANPGQMVDQKMVDTLQAEMRSDPTVETVVFYAVVYDETRIPPSPEKVQYIAIVRTENKPVPQLTRDQILQLAKHGTIQTETATSHQALMPWIQNGRLAGVTYVEMSRDALSREFWKKELPLLRQVIAWTASGVLALSAIGIFAYRAWRRLGRVQQRAELAQKGLLAERGLTAAVLAHEIRNPLAALRFQLHSLRKNAEQPQRVIGTSETIDSELSRIQQLVTDYLEHEKATSLRVQRVNLEEAAQKLKTLMDELLRQSETRLTIESSVHEPVWAACDPHALRQVLMNLVLNAQQAMGRGGSIAIRIGRDQTMGTIDVSDTGPGIPEEMKARLFKPFQTTRKEGHGIGLALVKRFVDNFGGNVSVDSAPGRGTTFSLKLPLADVASAEPAAPAGEVEGVKVTV